MNKRKTMKSFNFCISIPLVSSQQSTGWPQIKFLRMIETVFHRLLQECMPSSKLRTTCRISPLNSSVGTFISMPIRPSVRPFIHLYIPLSLYWTVLLSITSPFLPSNHPLTIQSRRAHRNRSAVWSRRNRELPEIRSWPE